jgi:hypothetical protein
MVLEFLLLDEGSRALLQSHWGALGLCRGRPIASRVTDCHSVEELGFHLLEKRDVTLLQGVAV